MENELNDSGNAIKNESAKKKKKKRRKKSTKIGVKSKGHRNQCKEFPVVISGTK